MRNSKRYNNSKFIYGFLSVNRSVSIPKELLFGRASLLSLRLILKTNFPEANKYIKTGEVVAALNLLRNEGNIRDSADNCIVNVKNLSLADTKNAEFLSQYLFDVVPDCPENNNTWKSFSGWEALLIEYLKTIQFLENCLNQQFQIANRFLDYLILSGQYKKGLSVIRSIKKSLVKMPDNFALKSTILAHQAEIFRMMGKNSRAEKLLRPAIARLEKNAIQHQLLLAQLYKILGLILLYDDKMRLSEAEDYLHRALLIRQMNLGEKHILTIASSICMVEYFNLLGNAKKAFEYLDKIEEQLPSFENDYFSAWVADVKGLASYYNNNPGDAIQYCETGLITRRKFLNKEHPLLLESLHNIGYLLILSSKAQEGIQYIEQTYSLLKKVYSAEHQNYTVTVGVYSLCNLLLGNIDKAEEILLSEVQTILTFPRENYKLYEVAFERLIEHFKDKKKRFKEKDLTGIYLKLLRSRKNRYDQKYWRVLQRYFQLLKFTGQYADVVWVKQELSEHLYFEIQQKIKAKTITETALNNYGIQFKNEYNDYNRAEECYIKTLAINPNDSNTCSNYALLLTSVKKEDDLAEKYYLIALAYNPKNDVAFGNYAFFLQNARRKLNKAEICYQESLKLNSNDRCTYANYASLKLIQGDFEEAKKLASISLKMCIPSPNRLMARSLFCLIIIRMFECKYYNDLVGNMKFLFNYGIEHVPWDNRALIVFIKKLLNQNEFTFLNTIFNTINDYTWMEKLVEQSEWNRIDPLPFVSAYKSL